MSEHRTPPLDPRRLADLLHQAVGGVEPDPGGLNRISAGVGRRRAMRQTGLAAAVVLGVAGVSIATVSLGSSSSSLPAGGAGGTSSPTAVVTTPAPASPTATAAPVQLPVPARFAATSVSAISAQDWWVGGETPCSPTKQCAALAVTTDAGATFHALPLPDVGSVDNVPGPTVRFASAANGWIYGTGAKGRYFYATHDGGQTWRAQPATITSVLDRVEAAGGRVFALVDAPANGLPNRLYRSPIAADEWAPLTIPHPENGYRSGFTVVGQSIWLEGASAASTGGQPPHALYRSRDGGQTFTSLADPCSPDLGGRFDARADDAVWAFCATGTQGRPYLSVDGGASFSALAAFGMWPNSTAVAGIDAVTGFLYNDHVEVTRDGGRTFTTVVPGRASNTPVSGFYVGFTDAVHGFVVNSFGDLLRSDDAGRTFRAVLIR